MYNGIGLTTPRGSGTNGHVQRNWAVVRKTKDHVNYRTEDEIAKLDNSTNKQPNKEILDHERKRKIEVKCAELEDVLEQQGLTRDEVETKIQAFRAKLLDSDTVDRQPRDEFGRVNVRETHQLAEAQQEKNSRLREAFGISSEFVEGSSLQSGRQNNQKLEKVEKSLSSEDEPPKKKKKRESRSPEVKKDKKKKKKHKKERSSSNKKEKKKKRSRSSSSSASDTPNDSDSSVSEKRHKKKKKKRESKHKDKHARDESSDSSMEKEVSSKKSKSSNSKEFGDVISSKDTKSAKKASDKSIIEENRNLSKLSPPPEPHKSSKKSDNHLNRDNKDDRKYKKEDSNKRGKSPVKSRHRSTTPKLSTNRSVDHRSNNDDKHTQNSQSVYKKKDHSRSPVSKNDNQSSRSRNPYKRSSPRRSSTDRSVRKNRSRSKNQRRSRSSSLNHADKYKSSSNHRYIKDRYSPKPSKRYSLMSRKNRSPRRSKDRYSKRTSPITSSSGQKKSHRSRSRSVKKTEKATDKDENKTSSKDIFDSKKSDSNRSGTPDASPPRKISKPNDIPVEVSKKKVDNINKKEDTLSKKEEGKRSLSRESKSSSLSYSPAKRSPERYFDVLENLSDKEKEKYLSKRLKTDNYKKSKSTKKYPPQPVVHLRASSSENESSSEQRDVSKLDDEDDLKIKELDLLNSGLAVIAKESVEKKRLQQIAKEDIISHNNFTSVVQNISLPPKELTRSPSSEIPDRSLQNTISQLPDLSIKNNIVDPKVEKHNSKQELKRRRLQTPDKTRLSKSHSRSHSSSSASSGTSTHSSKKYSASSRGSSSHRGSKSPASHRSSARAGYSSSSSSSSSASSHSSRSRSRSGSSRSRSLSIPRRAGSPSFLDRRRITSESSSDSSSSS